MSDETPTPNPDQPMCLRLITEGMRINSADWRFAFKKYPLGAACILPLGHEGEHQYVENQVLIITRKST